jgi:hypothetical protein
MSTHPPPKNFEELQKLLALKRREQPPQRFFARFSESVLGNLDKPESPATMSWLGRMGVHSDLSPAVLGAISVLLVALLAAAIARAIRTEPAPPPLPIPELVQPPRTQPAEGQPLRIVPKPEEVPKSTDPVMAPDSPPFNSQAPKAGFNTTDK